MLVVPNKVNIQLIDTNGNNLKKAGVLLGIRTYANHKNNIELAPFISDQRGRICITKAEIEKKAEIFISYGIMDYGSLESANSKIAIHLWSVEELNRYTKHWNRIIKDKENRDYDKDPLMNIFQGKQRETMLKRSQENTQREKRELGLFKSCCNKELDYEYTKSIIDYWEGKQEQYAYKMKIKLFVEG